jgi:hypothetical protein
MDHAVHQRDDGDDEELTTVVLLGAGGGCGTAEVDVTDVAHNFPLSNSASAHANNPSATVRFQ